MPQKLIQTKLHDPENKIKGNCMATCLAMLLDLSIDDVPRFEDMDAQSWHHNLRMWLLSHNKMLLELDQDPKQDFVYIANGLSPRRNGTYHAVVYLNGELWADPHPSNDGILDEGSRWYWMIVDIGWELRRNNINRVCV